MAGTGRPPRIASGANEQEPLMSSPTTTTLEKPLESTTDNDDTPKMFHYVRKSKIAESAVMGSFVVALCGETFPVTRSPKPGSPVCPDCKKIYESLKA
jgi:hypothetical protein